MAVTLDNGHARLTVLPGLGAGAAAYDIRLDDDWQPIFRRADDHETHPFALSNILLVPFSGRISGGGFTFDGQFHAIERNMPNETYPIHGSAFALPWAVARQGTDSITLTLSANGPGPFRYEAEMTYALEGAALLMTLSVTNRGIRLPFGLGFHPWFVRDADTRLMAPAHRVWLEQDDHLPKALEPVKQHPDMDFEEPRTLPARWINNWFSGWDRRARIDWPARGLCADVTASETLDQYVVFSPAADSTFFCFEPVSHPVDAVNLEGGPASHGMRILEPGAGLSAGMAIRPRATSGRGESR